MRHDQAALDEGFGVNALPTERDPRADEESPKKERQGNPAWIPRVYDVFRKAFAPAKYNLEQEKRIKFELAHAISEDAAFDAVDLIYREADRYPMGRDVREAVERANRKHTGPQRPDYGDGPFMLFRDWYDTQDAEMQARVRRVFPSLKIHAETTEPTKGTA